MELSEKHCVPCEGGTPPMAQDEANQYLSHILGWNLVDGKKIAREFEFKDFKEAMRFVNNVAQIAEAEGHHPDIYVFYNKVKLELSTHAANGLTENDFILAAKINALPTI